MTAIRPRNEVPLEVLVQVTAVPPLLLFTSRCQSPVIQKSAQSNSPSIAVANDGDGAAVQAENDSEVLDDDAQKSEDSRNAGLRGRSDLFAAYGSGGSSTASSSSSGCGDRKGSESSGGEELSEFHDGLEDA